MTVTEAQKLQQSIRAARYAAYRLVEMTDAGTPAHDDASQVANEMERVGDLKADLRLSLTKHIVAAGYTGSHSVDWLVRKVALDLGFT